MLTPGKSVSSTNQGFLHEHPARDPVCQHIAFLLSAEEYSKTFTESLFDTLPLTSQFLESRLLRHCVQLFLYLNAIQSFQPLQLSSFYTCLYYTRATLDLLFLKHIMNALPLYCIYAFFFLVYLESPSYYIYLANLFFEFSLFNFVFQFV